MLQYRIAPSILSADMSRLGEEVTAAINAGGDFIHFDVMDNHYVPNLTFGSMICRSLRDYGVTAPIDVHLMATPVDNLIENFAQAGATYITIHPEASKHPDRSLQLIRDLGCKAGLSFNPGTSLTWLDYLIDRLDLILVMSVNPGFGGQTLIPSAYDKISAIRSLIEKTDREILLEVDGGIHCKNIAQIAEAGADTFVSGSAIFNSDNYEQTIKEMRAQLATVQP